MRGNNTVYDYNYDARSSPTPIEISSDIFGVSADALRPIPEPSTIVLASLGAASWLARAWPRRSSKNEKAPASA